jgi:hypothetical protein
MRSESTGHKMDVPIRETQPQIQLMSGAHFGGLSINEK